MRALKLLLTIVILESLVSLPAQAGVLYGLGGNTRGPVNLYRLNQTTGAATFVGATRQDLRGFTIDHTTGRGYASHRTSGGLWEVNLNTGLASRIVSNGIRFHEMVVAGNGDLFGFTSRRQGFHDFFRINKTTGQASLLNSNTNFGTRRWSVSYSRLTNQLTYLDSDFLGRIDQNSGLLTRTRRLRNFRYRPWSATDDGGDIYFVDQFQSRALWKLDQVSGNYSWVGAHGVQLTGLAFNNFIATNSNIVPEPASLSMWTFVLLGLTRLRRRS